VAIERTLSAEQRQSLAESVKVEKTYPQDRTDRPADRLLRITSITQTTPIPFIMLPRPGKLCPEPLLPWKAVLPSMGPDLPMVRWQEVVLPVPKRAVPYGLRREIAFAAVR